MPQHVLYAKNTQHKEPSIQRTFHTNTIPYKETPTQRTLQTMHCVLARTIVGFSMTSKLYISIEHMILYKRF